ncbi:N-6 DNA methylase [Verrucosispora sp. FIM060022]|uniref:N-6 DNA methylase n=1 Tax=Verrucosispora sp. FIM060022 TaxID=1479020 RepID=UPI000F867623|nr:N-6 DNA methylase [Verrucosispora sp. FIM060022]RUL93711.1 helix-turn-helix domain-containing protein [Verrucosispora sp. FIM060022]
MTRIESVPATLRAIRANLNLTQVDLAERLGVSFATVNRWEGGGNKPQKAAIGKIVALAEEAGVDTADLPAAGAVVAVNRKRGRRPSTTTPTTKPMEQMLWDAACSIRGEKDAPRFKDYLLPLLFLKRLSDVFDDEISRLAEDYGDHDVALEIAESDHELVRFYLPPEARWGVIAGRLPFDWPLDERGRSTAPKDIGEHLTKAVRAVVRHNPGLAGVIDVVDFAAERNGERDINPAKLRTVVEKFSDPRYRLGLADVQPDFLGRAYEYLLRKFAEGSGQSAGEFFTPTEVGFLMARILRPKPGETCHDYACGSGGLLIKLQLVARELDPTSKVPLKMYGQELQAESYAVAEMNSIIHDMEVDLRRGDTMINPKFRDAAGSLKRYDIVVANPMWNQPFSPDIFEEDPFDRFNEAGGVTSGKGDWAWLQHTLATMYDGGRAAVVLDSGAMTRGSGSKNEDKERNIRKWFVERDLIDGVILLPENLFYNTTAAGVIVVLARRKSTARKGKIVMLNASSRFVKGKPKNHISSEDIVEIARLFVAGEESKGELTVITTDDARGADYNLSPTRWVTRRSEKDEIGSVDTLLSELLELDARAQELTASLGRTLQGVRRVSA